MSQHPQTRKHYQNYEEQNLKLKELNKLNGTSME
jgi:hypothetical protein